MCVGEEGYRVVSVLVVGVQNGDKCTVSRDTKSPVVAALLITRSR